MRDQDHNQQVASTGVWPPWLWLGGLAAVFSMAHLLIDFQVGLFGASSSQMSPGQAALVLVSALLYAWWGVSFALATGGGEAKAGLLSLLALALVWAFLGNGVVGIAACPPPCSGASPYQDLAHIGSVIFGAAAAYTTWRALRSAPGSVRWWGVSVPVGLTAAMFALEGLLFASRGG